MNIAFTGGGSGGHIMPIASLIEYRVQDTEIKEHCKLFRFGEATSMEEKISAQFSEVTFIPIPVGKRRRYRTPKAILQNIGDLRKGITGIFVAGQQLKKHAITHLFCKGGFVALPVCIAAYLLRIPISMHESDMHAGVTNRFVAKIARHRFVGFPGVLSPSITLGQLLSPRLLTLDEEFLPELQQVTKPIILVMGGSQGAGSLFSRLLHYLENTKNRRFHRIVLLGSKNEHYSAKFRPYHDCVTLQSFIDKPEQMARIYQLSDICITRGSATSLAEQQLFGITKIIVPTPYTGGNHQWYNGIWYRDSYGDLLIEQNDRLEEKLTGALEKFVDHKKTLQSPNKEALEKPLRAVRNELLGG